MPAALAADHHDVVGVHPRRGAVDGLERSRCRDAANAGHRGLRGDARRDAVRHLSDAGVLLCDSVGDRCDRAVTRNRDAWFVGCVRRNRRASRIMSSEERFRRWSADTRLVQNSLARETPDSNRRCIWYAVRERITIYPFPLPQQDTSHQELSFFLHITDGRARVDEDDPLRQRSQCDNAGKLRLEILDELVVYSDEVAFLLLGQGDIQTVINPGTHGGRNLIAPWQERQGK